MRRTKEQIRIDREVETACNKHSAGRSFNVFDLSKISQAGHEAAKDGKNIDEAVLAACIKYDQHLPEHR